MVTNPDRIIDYFGGIMLGKELLTYVDHTLLRPIATWDEIKVSL